MQQVERIQAVILDWAGTTLDFGCMAPVVAFQRAFELEGVPITVDEARQPMGAHKRDHIAQLCALPSVRTRWQQVHRREPGESDVDRIFARFVPLQLAALPEHSRLIPGTREVVDELRRRGMRIGSTTGYTSEMAAITLRDARAQGYEPDIMVCASDVPAARPWPYMCFENAMRLGASDVRACVKVDDTLPGIAEGRAAGMWTIGLAISGNEVGLPLEAWLQLSPEEQRVRRVRAYRRMRSAGAHYIIDTIADVVPCIDAIEARLARAHPPRAASAA
jgi:phosphonoacetaldehyde hydrolase